ncbi:Proton-coupled amino acid transporter 2, variant 2 [Clonorchis sinensis]|uniref:Proton-coupled amino acid transporter 2, variant 2 n=1 Tax=Clonorchis sinensis TaxID=79923 RepID=A0A8T1M793_CLOSI|nr:Proton-coupled amino acid transporter 2, variant 2 [Clonorchis sinensis]
MNFIKGNIGTGVLSMPVVLRYSGLWTGFFMIIFAGSVASYLMRVLVRTSRSVREKYNLDHSKMDYTETVFYVFKYGPPRLRKPKGKIKHTVNVFLIVTQIGFSCVYTLFITDNLRYVLPIESKMAHPEFYLHPFGVLSVGMTIIISLNAAFGFFGYLKFGEKAEGTITLNIPHYPWWFSPVQPLFIVAIYFTYLLQFYIPASIFARLMEKLRCHREASERRRYINLKVMRALLVMFAYVMVITIPKLDLMISLIGAFASSILAFILPPVLEIVHLWEDRHRIKWFWLTVVVKHTFFISIGLLSFVGGTVATLLQLIEAFNTPDQPKSLW